MVNKYSIIRRAGNVTDFRAASTPKDDDKDASIQYNQATTFKPVLKPDETQFRTGDAGTYTPLGRTNVQRGKHFELFLKHIIQLFKNMQFYAICTSR